MGKIKGIFLIFSVKMIDKDILLKILQISITEDLKNTGDITSNATLRGESVNFSINARESQVLCGVPVIQELFSMYAGEINYVINKVDGEILSKGDCIINGSADAARLFSIERISLNFLQHLSGIASITNTFVKRVEKNNVTIRSTRKTTPCLRNLEMYAVHIGGGESYRSSLNDKILIKDNHIASCGGVLQAIERVRFSFSQDIFIAIECDNISQVQEALSANIGLILLDNMSLQQIKEAVRLVAKKTKIEVSGGVTLSNVQEISKTGIDYISVGLITNAAPNKDIGLDIL